MRLTATADEHSPSPHSRSFFRPRCEGPTPRRQPKKPRRRVRPCKWIALCCLALPLAPAAPAAPPEEMDEAFLHFRYRGVVSTMISGLYDGERIYLPLADLFQQLQIDHEFHPDRNIVEGFFLEEENPYRIDLATGTAEFGEKKVAFTDADFVVTELETYLLPDIYEELFDLRFNVNLRRLTLALATSHTLPVIREQERSGRRTETELPRSLRAEAPLLFDRERRLLDGAFFDYSWTSRYQDGRDFHNYHVFGGGELLGGDLQGSFHGATRGEGLDFSSDDLRWRYVFDPNPVLTQFLAGGLASTGLSNQSFRGVRLTNEPVEPRRLIGFYRLQGRTEPDWDVELYLNNRLIEATPAGPTGDYSFQLPLGYGTQQTTLRFYGPTGEFEEEERRFSVPFLFLPPGEVNYSLDAGQTLRDERDLLQASAVVGITDRFTAGIGADYTEALPAEEMRQPVPYHTLSYRVGDAHIVSFENAPDALQRLTLNAFYPNQSSWETQFIRYRGHPLYGLANVRAEARGSLFIPFSIREQPFTFRLRGRALDNRNRTDDVFYNPEIDIRHRRSLYSFGVEETRSNRTETLLVAGFRTSLSQPDIFRNLIFRARYRYDPRRSTSEELEVDASRNITRNGRLRAGWRRNFAQRTDHAEVSFTYDFPVSRSTTTYRRSGGSDSTIQNFRGSIAYDAEHKRFVGNQRSMVGSSGAAFRPYVDYEGTGSFDEGDVIINDRIVRFRESVSSRYDADGIYRAHNLMPYRRYSVEIDVDRVRNPLWAPRTESFSFVTDPNRFKPIDVPFYVSGFIDGTVLRVRDGKTTPVGGLRLLLRQIDGDFEARIPVFSDGSYYHMGLPPGEYELEVDPLQTTKLQLRPEPAVHRFEVEVTREGDFVDGLNFLLRTEDEEKR